jgi:hypothetical protein
MERVACTVCRSFMAMPMFGDVANASRSAPLTPLPRLGPQLPGQPLCFRTMARWCNTKHANFPYCAVACRSSADFCGCSVGGCNSSWKCLPSRLCHSSAPDKPSSAHTSGFHGTHAISTQRGPADSFLRNSSGRVTLLVFLSFNQTLVRRKYAKKPQLAYRRGMR